MGHEANSRALDIDEALPERVVPLDERTWLLHHREGDPNAFAELVAAYQARVYSYLARCGVPAPTRDDLFQEIFLKVHKAADSYRPSRALAPWLFTIVANTVRNHWRSESAAMRRADAMPLDNAAPDLESITATSEVVSWLDEAIPKLPPAQREALVLVTISGLKLEHAAAALDVPVNTVKTLLRRARISLASELAGLGGES